VLIVDDEPLVRASIAATLREQGYRVLEAGNGAEAVDLLASGELIHLLITDYAMPGLRGSEVARTAIAMIPGLRVLIITGYADDRDAGLDAWKGRILRKPFTPAVLAEQVHEALSATGRHGKVVPLRPLPGFRAGGFQ
jgi:CheY-like chemotaxis protein